MLWPEALIRLQEIDLEFQHINQRLTEIETKLNDQIRTDPGTKRGRIQNKSGYRNKKKTSRPGV